MANCILAEVIVLSNIFGKTLRTSICNFGSAAVWTKVSGIVSWLVQTTCSTYLRLIFKSLQAPQLVTRVLLSQVGMHGYCNIPMLFQRLAVDFWMPKPTHDFAPRVRSLYLPSRNILDGQLASHWGKSHLLYGWIVQVVLKPYTLSTFLTLFFLDIQIFTGAFSQFSM